MRWFRKKSEDSRFSERTAFRAFQLPQALPKCVCAHVAGWAACQLLETAMHLRKRRISLSVRGHSALRLPSHMLVAVFSFLFLVSSQLCYAMAHDMPAMPGDVVQVTVGCHSGTRQAGGMMAQPHHADQSAPMDHGAKSPAACVMMTCGCLVQMSADLSASAPIQDFGLPPLVAALDGSAPHGVLRPPIFIQA